MQFQRFFSANLALALLISLGAGAANAAASGAERVFKIGDEKQRDTVIFTSDAPLELIHGNTSKVSGEIKVDENFDLSKPSSASFEVDLASIDTGIPLRNEHMRDNFLETKKYPKAIFTLKSFKNPPKKLVSGQKVKLQATGDFSLHGKTVSKTVPVELLYRSKCPQTESKREGCDLIQIKATFPVAFQDHAIKRPEVVFQKLADTVIVTVSATAYNQVASGSKTSESKDSGQKASK